MSVKITITLLINQMSVFGDVVSIILTRNTENDLDLTIFEEHLINRYKFRYPNIGPFMSEPNTTDPIHYMAIIDIFSQKQSKYILYPAYVYD